MYGSFSESSLNVLESLFDFTRCVRADGSVYGSRGKCRKGMETGAKEQVEKTPRSKTPTLTKNEKIALKVMADKSLRSDRKRIAEMVRLGVPANTDFVALVGSTKDKIGLKAEQTIRGSAKKAKVSPEPRKSLAERMAAAAEKLEKAPQTTKSPARQKETPKVTKAGGVMGQTESQPKSKVPDERLKKSFDQALSTLDRLEKERKQLSKEGVKWSDPRAKAVAEKMALAQNALTTIRQAYHAVNRESFLRESSKTLNSERLSRKLRAEAEREAKEKGLNVYTLPEDHPLKKKFIRANAIDEERTKVLNPRKNAAFYGEPLSLSKARTDGGGKVASSVPSGLPKGGASRDLKDFLEGSSVVMAFPVSGFAKFVKEGEAKNAFDRGTGGIKKGKKWYLDNRREGEKTVLNIPENADPRSRPVYAALEHPDRTRSLQGGSHNQMSNYGGIQVILNPSTKDRSTFTVGDSLDYSAPRNIKGSPVRDPANPTIVNSTGSREVKFDPGGGTSSDRMTIVGNRTDLPANPPYVEAQIHGGLKMSDVQEVRVFRGHDLPAATRKLLDKQGIRIVELPPQMEDLIHYSDSPGYRDITKLSME